MTNPFDIWEEPNCHSGYNYAVDVVEGRIINCKYIIGACKRYLSDIDKAFNDPTYPYYFSTAKAERFLRLVQKFEHVVGTWKSPEILFEPWQKFLFMNVMGFIVKETHYRRFRTAHVEVARGNAKSTTASQLVLYFVGLEEDRKGMHISTVASRKEQARIVFDAACAMARKNKKFLKASGIEVRAHDIVHKASYSFIKPKSADAGGLEGLTDSLCISDELHVMSKRVFDTVQQGMGKIPGSLLFCITTAGDDIESVGYSQTQYAKKVAIGEHVDESFFSLPYTLDEGDDIWNPLNWPKANPNWGVSVDPVKFAQDASKAQVNPADAGAFKIKRLNLWTSEEKAYFDLSAWDECADETLRLEDFLKKKAREGVDLAARVDLCSLGYVFREIDDKGKEIYTLFDRSYIPEQRYKELNSALYQNCVKEGHLLLMPGAAINLPDIGEQVEKDSKDFKLEEVMYDPWSATEFAQRMVAKRINMVEFRMNVATLSEPMKALDIAIREKRVRHNGSPLLRWCLGNVVAKTDANGNAYPRKSHERLKIDPIIAIIMGIAGWIQDEQKASVYKSRGIRSISI